MAKSKGKDIQLALSGETVANIQKALETRSKILGRVRSYESTTPPNDVTRNANFVKSPYELGEIARAMDIEAYVMQSIRKHRTAILKEGFEISGNEEETVNYVKNRLFEISMVTGIPTLQWLRDLITNIIAYHNGILIYRRDPSRSSGKKVKMYGKTINPIAGIFVGDTISMGVEIDRFGTPIRWKQRVESPMIMTQASNGPQEVYTNIFEPEDVVHIPIDRKTGMTFGTPYLITVLDDIRALRKLEELILVIAEKEAFPLYHYKIGTPERPAMVYNDGGDEVSLVMSQLQNMPSNGYIATSERHEVKLISREKAAMDLSPLLEYFEARVLAGLSISPMDIGRGDTSNRGTGNLIGKNLEDSAKDYQSIISEYLTQFLVIPLLLEGGYDVTLENMVYFEFPTIDQEDLRAHQNHGLQLYLGNAISLQEYRNDYLKKKGELDDTDTNMHKQLTADITLARAQPKPATSSSGKSSISAIKRAAANRAKPANQYGSTNKSRFKKKNDYLETCQSAILSMKDEILKISADPTTVDATVTRLLSEFVNKCVAASDEVINEAIESGFHAAEDQYFDQNPEAREVDEELGGRTVSRFFTNFVAKSFWKVLNPYKPSIIRNIQPDLAGNTASYLVIKTVEAIAKDLKSLIPEQIETAKRFGFAKYAKRVGYNKIDFVNDDQELVEQINISEIIYKDLMPTDTNSNCFMRLTSSENNTSEDL